MVDTVVKPEILSGMILSGRKFSRKEVVQIIKTVEGLPNLSRREVAYTICEHLNWKGPSGSLKIESCLTAFEVLEKKGLVSLPTKETRMPRKKKSINHTCDTDEPQNFCSEDIDLARVELVQIENDADRLLWNEYVDRYHLLGYSHPVGCTLRYFAVDSKTKEKLACLLFTGASAIKLEDRDKWIGWTNECITRNRLFIINNSRFLILPWVKIENLASKILGLVVRVIQKDWYRKHNYLPVLLETFVDKSTHIGTSYKASNWIHVGQTKGRGRSSNSKSSKSIKDIYYMPLTSDFKEILCSNSCHKSRSNRRSRSYEEFQDNNQFLDIWSRFYTVIISKTKDYDSIWCQRKPILNTLIIVLLILRLTFSKNSQGYSTTIEELWDNLRKQNLPLPRTKPVTAAAFCLARRKMPEQIFKELNTAFIEEYEHNHNQDDFKWHGHRLFAVDGSKINLPIGMMDQSYKPANPLSNYPQGLLSCIYQIKSKIPYDFGLYSHNNERAAALDHLLKLRSGDLVLYDRGYYSYYLLFAHRQKSVEAVFRLLKGNPQIEAFVNSEENDAIINVDFQDKGYIRRLLKEHPDIGEFTPLPLRLIKYEIEGEAYYLGTTLLDRQKYKQEYFAPLYHSRWGVEELYKISKSFIDVTDFHGQTERCAKQELFAQFMLITMTRICSNEVEKNHPARLLELPQKNDKRGWQVNFKNALATTMRSLESIFNFTEVLAKKYILETCTTIGRYAQKSRPGRSYIRKSMKPLNKWVLKDRNKIKKDRFIAITGDLLT